MTEADVTQGAPTPADTTAAPYGRGPRRRGRALRTTLIVVVVLGGLFVGADRLALHFAESEVADKIKSTQGLTVDPDVSIKGFPFLTQVASKKLDTVDIGLDGLTTHTPDGRTVRITELSAALHDVKVSGDFSSAVADTAEGTARIGFDDLSAAAGAGITVGPADGGAGGNRVKITGSLLGMSLSANGTVSLVDGDTVRLRADSVPAALGKYESEVRERTDFEWTLEGLPSGMKMTKLQVADDGIHATVGGQNVELTN